MKSDDFWNPKIMWLKHYAFWPRFLEGKFIWRKYYYLKFKQHFWADFDTMEEDMYWKLEKTTLNPAEYILFGATNEEKI